MKTPVGQETPLHYWGAVIPPQITPGGCWGGGHGASGCVSGPQCPLSVMDRQTARAGDTIVGTASPAAGGGRDWREHQAWLQWGSPT